MLAIPQHHKDLYAAHGAEEAKRNCVLVLETSYVQEGQKEETAVNETEEDYPLSPRTHG